MITAHWIQNNTATEARYIPSVSEARQYFRQGHDKELRTPGPTARTPDRNYRGNAGGKGRDTGGKTIPEPFRVLPDHQTPVDCGYQSLIRHCNPEHTPEIVDKVLDYRWVLANNTGIRAEGRKNCRTGAYMDDPTAKWPALHTPIITGGALLSGVEDGSILRIESILTSGPVPTAEYVLSRPWLWFWLTEINSSGGITYMTVAATDGTRRPVRMPLLSRLPLYMPLAWLHRMPATFDPAGYDPRWMA